MGYMKFLGAMALLFGSSIAGNIPWDDLDEKFWGKKLQGNGPYGFGACNDEQYKILKQLFIDAGWQLEQRVINEVIAGTKSPAFSAFFSTNDNVNQVGDILKDMDDGNTHRSVDQKLRSNVATPFFACVNFEDGNPSEHEALTGCTDPSTGRQSKAHWVKLDEALETHTFRAHWLLCPSFFNETETTSFPSKESCPTLSEEGDYFVQAGPEPPQYGIQDSRFAIIMHILAITYSKNAVDPNSSLNEVLYVDPTYQPTSAASFTFFTSMVVAQCPAYPTYQYGDPLGKRADTRIKPKFAHDPSMSMESVIGPDIVVSDTKYPALAKSLQDLDKTLKEAEEE